MAGIINSIETDSSWKTMNLSEECRAFADVIRRDFSKPVNAIRKVRETLNYEDISGEDDEKAGEHRKEA